MSPDTPAESRRMKKAARRQEPSEDPNRAWGETITKILNGGKVVWRPSKHGPSEGRLEMQGAWGKARFVYRIWPLLAGHQVEALVRELTASAREGEGALILVDHVSGRTAAELRRQGLNYLDRVGNAWITTQGLHVSVQGVAPARKTELARGARPGAVKPRTGVRLVFLFLKHPSSPAWTYRKIAEAAGVSLGSVGQTIETLRRQDFLVPGSDGNLRIERASELRRWWEGSYSEQLRPTLDRGRFRITGPRDLDQLAEEAKTSGATKGILIGGEVAAARLTGYLRPAGLTLHVKKGAADATSRLLRLAPDPAGNVQLLEWMGEADRYEGEGGGDLPLADPLLVRAELLAQPDERLRDVARLIEERYLRPTDDIDTAR